MKNKKKYTNEEIEKIVGENRRLMIENSSMQKILQSRRFRFAEKIANMYNAIFPEGSLRRKALKAGYAPIRRIKKVRSNENLKRIESCLKGKNKIVIMHSIPWDTPLRQRPHHLANCLAKNKKTALIYLEPDEQLKSFRKISSSFVTTNSWENIFNLRLSPKKKYYFFFNNVSNIPFETIKKIKDCGYSIVYEYIDEFHEDVSGSLVNQLETWEKLPDLGVELVLASADKLYNEAEKHFGKEKVLMSKNAVNVEDFDFNNFKDIPAPNDLKKIIKNNRPIVGYYGALAPWLDYGLISKSAKNNPDMNFVLIGVNYQNALDKLDQTIENVYYLGPKKYADLPKYSAHFDCAIIPFKTGEIAKGTSPVKLFEYMAMGLPTVGTRDLNECRGYEYVYLSNDADDFSAMLRKAIDAHKNSKTKEKLLKQAKENSWQIRADDVMKKL